MKGSGALTTATRGLVAFAALTACHGTPSSDPPDPSASPQAKAEPAPIANPPSTTPGATSPGPSASAGAPFVPPPQPMRADEAPTADPLPKETVHEPNVREPTKEVAPAVYTLTFALRSSDVAPPPKGLELSAQGVEAARRKSEPTLTVDFTPGHARAQLHDGFVLPEGTEIRVRTDRFGYVVVSPDATSYRVAATGALRAIVSEALFDVSPTSAAEVTARGEGPKRLGRATRKVEVATRAAHASFELGHMPEAGDGGVLVCRMLLDLMSAGPATPACADGDVPLHVELKWSVPSQAPSGGANAKGRVSGISVFEAVGLVRRTDVPASAFLTPPPSAVFARTGEAASGSHVFLTRADLAAMRVGGADPAAPHAPESAPAVLSLHNSTDELRYVWLDGVSLAWLAPGGRLDVSGVPHGRATVQWRTFLGDAIDAPQSVTLPAMVDTSAAPGGPATSGDSPPP